MEFTLACKVYFQEPVVLTDTSLVSSALHWDLDYLNRHMGNGSFNVYISKTNKFKYYDEKRADLTKDFERPTVLKEMKFQEFVEMLNSRKENDERYVSLLLSSTPQVFIIQVS